MTRRKRPGIVHTISPEKLQRRPPTLPAARPASLAMRDPRHHFYGKEQPAIRMRPLNRIKLQHRLRRAKTQTAARMRPLNRIKLQHRLRRAKAQTATVMPLALKVRPAIKAQLTTQLQLKLNVTIHRRAR